MKKTNQTSGAVGLLLSFTVGIESFRLHLGTLHAPQAGFFPFVASLILGLFSLSLLLSGKRQEPGTGKKRTETIFNSQRFPKVLYVTAALFAYAIFFNSLGFILITGIFIGFLLSAVGGQRWYVVAIGSVSVPIIVYIIFNIGLQVNLPRGFFGF